jgi:hypothetical protein
MASFFLARSIARVHDPRNRGGKRQSSGAATRTRDRGENGSSIDIDASRLVLCKWLSGTNAHLGNRRPIDLLARNRVAEVVGAIEQADLDAYA